MIFNGVDFDTYFKNYPNNEGYFGRYGGVYVSEELKAAMAEITEAYFTICKSSKFIAELRKSEDMTVFLTTHYMEEAADADYVVILDSGSIVAEGTPLELKNSYTGDFITIYNTSEDLIKPLGLPYEAIRDAFRISVPNTHEATNIILKHPDLFVDYEITKGKMDDVFLAVTGKKLTGGEDK